MDPDRASDLQGAANRAAAAMGSRRGVRDAVRALTEEALRGSPSTPARILEVARAIRSGIAGASGIGNAEAQAAAGEALAGLDEALGPEFDALQRSEIGGAASERSATLAEAEALQREFGAKSLPLAAFVQRLRLRK